MNARMHDAQQRSRLGRLLIERGVITEAQLRLAIERQAATGRRLGETLVELQFATQRQVDSVLRKQHNIRLVASFVAVLMTPLYAMGASPPRQQTELASMADAAATRAKNGGMTPLDDDSMAEIAGQGLDYAHVLLASQQPGNAQPGGAGAAQQAGQQAGLKALGDLAKALNPLLSMLDYNLTVKGLVYGPNASATLNGDGSLTVNLETSIAEVDLADLRVKGSPADGPSFGSITMRNVDLSGTTITIRSH